MCELVGATIWIHRIIRIVVRVSWQKIIGVQTVSRFSFFLCLISVSVSFVLICLLDDLPQWGKEKDDGVCVSIDKPACDNPQKLEGNIITRYVIS